MRFFPFFLLALSLAASASETEVEGALRAAVPADGTDESADGLSNEQERRLDDLASTFEDVAVALSAVEDATDADLIASRVAVDFLLLRDINTALKEVGGGGEVRSEFARSFTARCTAARQAAEEAMERLRVRHCYESDALLAALSLASLMKEPLEGVKLREAGLELVANNLEMLLLLLDEVQDTTAADQVALLVMTSLVYDTELTRFAQEQESHTLEQEKSDYLAKRIEGARLDFRDLLTQLAEKQFFGSSLLKEALERRRNP